MSQKGMDPVAMQMNIRNNTMEMQECIKDLYKWESDMHKKEQELQKSKASQPVRRTEPAIRGQAPTVLTGTSDEELNKPAATLRHGQAAQKPSQSQGSGAAKTAAAHTYDYFKDRWENFDVDAALAEVDEPAKGPKQVVEEVVEEGQGNVQEEVPIRTSRSPEEERDMWKNKGNEYFKFGDWHKAKECYSSSLAAQESNAAYTNRALACIKLKEWQQAEDDCTQVIKSDPKNLKAWQRRAEARKGKGDTVGHLRDIDAALQLAPESPAISQQLRKALPQYLTGQGLSMPSVRAAVHVEAELNDPEPQQIANQQACHQLPPQQQGSALSDAAGAQKKCGGTDKGANDMIGQETVASHTNESDKSSHVQASSGQPAECAVSDPVVSADSNPAGKGQSSSRPSNASGLVAKPQVNLAPAEIYVPSVAPTTSAEFECRWRATKGDKIARAAYLDLIDPNVVVALFGNALTPDVLEGAVRTLLTVIQSDRNEDKVARRVSMLRQFTRVQRFSMNLMLVAKGAKKELAGLWDDCMNASEQDSIKQELLELKKLYKL